MSARARAESSMNVLTEFRTARVHGYRILDGKACVDLRIRSAKQLFDGRDPSPFRERDLDEDAVDYIVGAVEEIPTKLGLRLVIWVSEDPSPELGSQTIVEAVRAHFVYELDRVRRRAREHVRRVQLALLVGLTALVVFLTLAERSLSLPAGRARILHEGLVITGWVAMWRPLELLLFDWWPLLHERAVLRRILASDIAIIHGQSLGEVSAGPAPR